MPSNSNPDAITPEPVALRAAATVVLLRDAPDGLQVFLMKRHSRSDVLGGVYVFPGGKVDAADTALDMGLHLDQPLPALHAGLNEADISEHTAGGLYVAALRELFEEAGVLLAQGDGGAPDAIACAQAAALLREGQGFNAVLARLALRLQTRSVVPWTRWVTPTSPFMMNKRFDTRFFIAAVPAGQRACHDHHETTASVWLAPHEALRQYWEGKMEMAPPQIMSLAHLARFSRVDAVLAAARSCPPPLILPESFEVQGDGGGRCVCYPGDSRHPVRQPAIPGPSRLYYRSGRFEPEGGFEALFG
ncbi:MAG: NUDIX hydrolase [Polaromonas sp.]